MAEHSRSNSNDLLHILGVANVWKVCKSFITKCYPEKPTNFLKKGGNKPKTKAIEDDNNDEFYKFKIHTKKHNPDIDLRGDGDEADKSIKCSSHDGDAATGSGPSRLLRNLSHVRRSHTLPKKSLLRSLSLSQKDAPSRTATPRAAAAPIVFSNSSGLLKPPPMEKHLDCTLEELCFGCVKNVSVTRNAVKDNGRIVEEEETVTIKVEAGWRKGTKITFEGKGDQRAGAGAADLIFVIGEKEHSLFKREEDDLQLSVEILLVDALTGCTLLIPLLGGETMSLTVEDVVHPGYQQAVEGEGMPRRHEPGERGDLVVGISVRFPDELTEEQRSSAAKILQQSCGLD